MNGCNQFNFCVCFAHGDLSCCLDRRKPPGENEHHRFSWTQLILLCQRACSLLSLTVGITFLCS